LSDDFFSQRHTEIDDQGLKATPWPLAREDLYHTLCALVQTHGHLLICAPFASGKTALAQVLEYHLRKNNTVYIILLLGCDVSWAQHWLKQTSMPWDAIMTCKQPVYVIIDEVQASYSKTSKAYQL
jgi:hypothetical protein